MSPITPQVLLRAYAAGIFPMAESAQDHDALYWVEPDERGVIPLAGLDGIAAPCASGCGMAEISTSASTPAFAGVIIRECAARTADRVIETWINTRITTLYTQLHQHGLLPQSVETWRDGETGRRALWCPHRCRRSSARACSTGSGTPRRWPSSILSPGS